MTYDPEILMVFNNEGEKIEPGKYTMTVTVTGEYKSVEYEIQLDLVAGVLFGDSDPYALSLEELLEEIGGDFGDEFFEEISDSGELGDEDYNDLYDEYNEDGKEQGGYIDENGEY